MIFCYKKGREIFKLSWCNLYIEVFTNILANLRFRGISIFADEGLTAKTAKNRSPRKKNRFTVHKDHSCEISLNVPMLIFIMGEVCASIEAIHLIFQMRRDIIILHHPAKINENRPITLGDNRCTQTYRPIHNDENNNSPKAKFLAEVIAIYNMYGQNIKH